MDDPQFIAKRVVKAYQHLGLHELPEAPVDALRGLSKNDAQLLYDSFYVKTIRDLADLKFIKWAQEVCALENVPQEKIDMGAFEQKLVKSYEQTPIDQLIEAPPYALQGLSEADSVRLNEAFSVKTVQDLATLKFARFAQELCMGNYQALSSPIQNTSIPGPAQEPSSWLRWFSLAMLGAFAIIVLLLLWRSCNHIAPDDRDPTARDMQQVEPDPGATENNDTQTTRAVSETYIVQIGDTLFDISQRQLGSPDRWDEIHDANNEKISNPHLIYPGQELIMPSGIGSPADQ